MSPRCSHALFLQVLCFGDWLVSHALGCISSNDYFDQASRVQLAKETELNQVLHDANQELIDNLGTHMTRMLGSLDQSSDIRVHPMSTEEDSVLTDHARNVGLAEPIVSAFCKLPTTPTDVREAFNAIRVAWTFIHTLCVKLHRG